MTNEQIQRIYNTKMRNIMLKNARVKQEQDDADRVAWEKTQANSAKINLALTAANMTKDLYEWRQGKLLDIKYKEDENVLGGLKSFKKYKPKEDRTFKEVLGDIGTGENIKRLTPKGGLEETEGYKEFKAKEKRGEYIEETFESPEFAEKKEAFKKDALSWQADEARPEVPLAEELAVDELIEADQHVFTDDLPLLDMALLNENAKRSLYDRYYQDQASSGLSGMPKLSYEKWLEGVETGALSGNYAEDASVHMGLGRYKKLSVPPAQPDVPLDVEDEFYTPTEEMIEGDDLPSPAPQPDYAKIQGAAEDQKLQALRELETTPGITPEVSSDPELEKALQGLEELDQPIPKAIESEGVPIDFASTEGFVKPGVEVPDAKPGGRYVGKTLGALQTGQQIFNIGKTLTDEDVSDADKALAGTQGVKLLADLAAKKAGQKTAVEAVKAGTKIGGKAAVGAVAGGVLGGYTMVTEAGEAKESWEEEDYDEAILHGIGAWSGSLQMGGAGMMVTGIGAPLGAVIYGIGTAGSVISSAGLFLEGLFGGDGEPDKPEKPKFNASKYFDSIRRSSYAY